MALSSFSRVIWDDNNIRLFSSKENKKTIRVFHWSAEKLSVKKPDGTRADTVFLIRNTAAGTTGVEIAAVPCSAQDLMKPSKLCVLLPEIVNRYLPSLHSSYQVLNDLISALFFKFGKSKEFWEQDPDHAVVIFFDLESVQSCYMIENGNRDAKIVDFEVEEIEEYLKQCPQLVVEGSRGMVEVESFVEIDEYSGSKELDCSICLEKIDDKDDIFATTHCSHNFHVNCLHQWMKYKEFSCPMCRQ